MTAATASVEPTVREHGALYWFVANSGKKMKSHYQRHRNVFLAWLIIIFFCSYALRAIIQPAVVLIRIYSFEVVLAMLAIWVLNRMKHRMKWKSWAVVLVLSAIVVSTSLLSWTPHAYMSLYFATVRLRKRSLRSCRKRIMNAFNLSAQSECWRIKSQQTMCSQPNRSTFGWMGNPDGRWALSLRTSGAGLPAA
jgi:hypothetical protein